MMDINLLLQIFLLLRHLLFEYDLFCFTQIFLKIPVYKSLKYTLSASK